MVSVRGDGRSQVERPRTGLKRPWLTLHRPPHLPGMAHDVRGSELGNLVEGE